MFMNPGMLIRRYQNRSPAGGPLLDGTESDNTQFAPGGWSLSVNNNVTAGNAWTNIASTLTANQGTSPDNTANSAALFTEDTASNRHIVYNQAAVSANKNYAWSAYVKNNSGSRYLVFGNDGVNVFFDLVNKVVTDATAIRDWKLRRIFWQAGRDLGDEFAVPVVPVTGLTGGAVASLELAEV